MVAVVACTEHGKGGGDVWDVEVNQLAEAACRHVCVPADLQDNCIGNLLDDTAAVRPGLGQQGEQRCLDCMRVKAQVFPAVVAPACEFNAAQRQQIAAACDIDPNSDFDFDGDPADDLDEACQGASTVRF